MADVIVLVSDRALRARVGEALDGYARPVFCHEVGEVRAAIAASLNAGRRVAATILTPTDRNGVPSDRLVAQVRSLAPGIPVLAYCSTASAATGELLQMARAGVSGILLRGFDDVGAELRKALAAADDDCVARHLVRQLPPKLPPGVRSVVEHCAIHGRQPLSVEGVAKAFGVHRRTLVVRFASAGMPQPRAVIGWVRMCLVAHAIDRGGISVERLAHDYGFPSAAALRNFCRRLTGMRIGEVRSAGGLRCVLGLFVATLEASRNRSGLGGP